MEFFATPVQHRKDVEDEVFGLVMAIDGYLKIL